MAGKDTYIDSLFKDGLKDAKIAPPQEVWENVSAAIEQKKSRNLGWIIFRAAAAIAILVSGIVIYFMAFRSMDQNGSKQIISETQQIQKEELDEAVIPETDGNEQADLSENISVRENTNEKLAENSSTGYDATQNERNKVNNKQIGKASDVEPYFVSEKSEIEVDEQEMFLSSTDNSIESAPATALKSVASLQPKTLKPDNPAAEPVYISKKQPAYYSSLPNPKPKDKWQLGAFYAPLYSYRMVESADVTSVQNQIIENSETGMVTYSGGFSVTYRASRRLKISSGLNVTKMGNAIENIVAYVSHYDNTEGYATGGIRSTKVSYQVNNSMGNIQTTEPNTEISNDPSQPDFTSFIGSDMNALNTAIVSNSSEITQDFTYIELPVLLKYSIIESKIDLNLLTGVSSFLMLDNEVTFKNYGGNDVSGRTNNVKSTNFSGSVGLGLAYDVTNHVQVYVDPVFKLFLNSINTSDAIDTYPYSFGLYSGISFVF